MTKGIGEDLVLESLYAAKLRIEGTELRDIPEEDGRLQPGVWDFHSWNTCTCGHIYGVTTNDDQDIPERAGLTLTSRITDPTIVDGLYEETLEAIARANDIQADGIGLAYAVSDATAHDDDAGAAELRDRALELINNTINFIEARQRKAMVAKKAPAARTGAPVVTDSQGVKA